MSFRKKVAHVMAATASTVGLVAAFAGPAGASGQPAAKSGTAYVVAPSGAALDHGGSTTPFTLQLPEGAVCPADTLHHGFLVYSYLTPMAMSPGSLTFPGGYPSSNLNLITTGGEPYVTAATAPFTGSVPKLPVFDWSRYSHQQSVLPFGVYNVGIACAFNQTRVQAYWNNTFRFSPSPSDPGGFTWTVTGPKTVAPAGSGSSSTVRTLAGTVLGAAAIVAVGLAVGLRRHRKPAMVYDASH